MDTNIKNIFELLNNVGKQERLDVFFKNKNKYDDRWNEQINNEYELEKELETERNYLENDKNDFENELKNNSKGIIEEQLHKEDEYNKLYDLVYNQPDEIKYTDTFYYIEPTSVSTSFRSFYFQLSRFADMVTKIYIELQFDSFFDDLSMDDKLTLLDGEVVLSIGGSDVLTINLLSCIFQSICKGDSIKNESGTIQILLFDFDTLKNDKYNACRGLPLISIRFHEIQIRIHFSKIKSMGAKLLVNGLLYDSDIRRNIAINIHEYLFFQNYQYIINSFDFNTTIDIGNHRQYFLFYFVPVEYSAEESCTNDLFMEYPEISEVLLFSSNEDDEKNNKVRRWSDDDILSFEIFGIKIYVLPLSPEMSSWEKISETLKNPLENMSLNYDKNEAKSYLNVYSPNYDTEKFYMNITEIVPNILSVMHGMCFTKFSK